MQFGIKEVFFQMSSVGDIFKAEAQSYWESAQSYGGRVGYRIPEYQRAYDWNEDNLKRLLEDCFSGFYSLFQQHSEEPYTFLGTLILVEEKNAERDFDGTSLAIIDGQQRLTSLALLCCCLLEEVLTLWGNIDKLQFASEVKQWFGEEVDLVTGALYECTTGQVKVRTRDVPFPRIVRESVDERSTRGPKTYQSDIASFLENYSQHYGEFVNNNHGPFQPNLDPNDSVSSNYQFLRAQIRNYVDGAKESLRNSDNEVEILCCKDFTVDGLKSLFDRSNVLEDEDERLKDLRLLGDASDEEKAIRLVLFCWYLLKFVVLTRVVTGNETYAFDIFDALNTTGQPLTAVETLKPLVVRRENNNSSGAFTNSPSASNLSRVEEFLDIFNNPDDRQKETKALVVSFALFYDGQKRSLNLNDQRMYLRSRFQSADRRGGLEEVRGFIEGIADIAEFRQKYWQARGIPSLDAIHANDFQNADERIEKISSLKLLMQLLVSMNHSLAVPILARYWLQYKTNPSGSSCDIFLECARALVAFIVFRRGVTGGTAGIDSDFRSIMNSLCLTKSLLPPSIGHLKEELRKLLSGDNRVKVNGKQSWLERASGTGLAASSTHLCRFLLFAAHDGSQPDAFNPGLLTREDVVSSSQVKWLTYENWVQAKYNTIEHIAPETDPGSGWDTEIYREISTKHTVGNLVPFPRNVNSSVGNDPWAKKRLFYTVMAEKSEARRMELIEEAKENDVIVPGATIDLLNSLGDFEMLEHVSKPNEWSRDLILSRTANILDLAWDRISPWLFDPAEEESPEGEFSLEAEGA